MASKLVPLKFRPGIFRNGTRYQAKGRWYDCALIRFFEKTIRAIGGWEVLQNAGGAALVFDEFTDTNGVDLSAHTPDDGSAWLYNGAAGDHEIDSGAAVAKVVGTTQTHARMTDDVGDDNIDVFVDPLRAAVAGDNVITGLWCLAKGLDGEGVSLVAEGSATDLALTYKRRNAAGTVVASHTVVAALNWPVNTHRRIGLLIEGTTATPYTATTLTGADRVTYTPIDITEGGTLADLRDGTHKKAGIVNFRQQDSMRFFLLRFGVNSAAGDVSISGAIRKLLAWRPNDITTPLLAIGTNKSVYAFSEGVLTNITPADLTTGAVDTVSESGQYGFGAYGAGNYGEGDLAQSAQVEAATWQFDTFGEYLLGVLYPSDKRLLVWDLLTATMTAATGGAPTNNAGVVVTNERFAFVLGAGGDPRKVQWPSRETLTDWTPSATNSAGSYLLPGNGNIMCGLRAPKSTLIWTNEDLFEAQYIGGLLLYRFPQVGQKCGIISRHAAAMVDGKAYWMDFGKFFKYDGTVRPMECDVSDFVFKDFNKTQAAKVFAVPMTRFGEIWWYYPSGNSDEPNRYVIYNYLEDHWNIGPLDRTAGIDRGATEYPMKANYSRATTFSTVYQHERGTERAGAVAPFLESGPMELGDRVMNIHGIVPDEATAAGQQLGSIEMRLMTSARPASTAADNETERGPYTMAERTDVRLNARIVRAIFDEIVAGDWRIGEPALEVSMGGLR